VWLRLFFKVFFTQNYIKIKKLFLTLTHQNDLKILKKINLKKIKFFKNIFEI
jgi:hypothetical protein